MLPDRELCDALSTWLPQLTEWHPRAAGTTIGKRYSRTDELGVPFDITVDGDTVEKDGTVTLRERDTTGQVRCAAASREECSQEHQAC